MDELITNRRSIVIEGSLIFEERVALVRKLYRQLVASSSTAYLLRAAGHSFLAGQELAAHTARAFEHLCSECSCCCCRSATAYFKTSDLLLIWCNDESDEWEPPLPSSRSSYCPYVGSEGCILPRTKRPEICAEHVCGCWRRDEKWDGIGNHSKLNEVTCALFASAYDSLMQALALAGATLPDIFVVPPLPESAYYYWERGE